MNDFRSRLKETTVTSIVTYILFVVAVVFADIMYLQLVMRVVESSLLVLTIAGAFALGGSVLILPRKLKNGDIKPGQQRSIAIAVLVTEFFVMAANVVVAFAEKSGDIPIGILGVYATYVAPITPVIAALGILLIWLADPIDKAKLTAFEVETAKKVAELDLKGQLSMTAVQAMEEFLQTDEARSVMQQAAREQGHKLLRDVLQMSGVQHETHVLPIPTKKEYDLDTILRQAGSSREQAKQVLDYRKAVNAEDAYYLLKSRLPQDLTEQDFTPLYHELMQNGHGPKL